MRAVGDSFRASDILWFAKPQRRTERVVGNHLADQSKNKLQTNGKAQLTPDRGQLSDGNGLESSPDAASV
jgi:hypothetical protein